MRVLSWEFIQSWKAYSKSVWCRAWFDTLEIFGFNLPTFFTAVLACLSWLVLWKVFGWGWAELSGEVVPTLAFLIVLLVVCAAIFFMRLLVAPVLIDKQQRERIDGLQRLTEPKVEIKFEAGNDEYERTEPLVCSGPAKQRLFCIGIHNPGTEMLHRCTVELTKTEPKGAFLPIRLKLHKETPQLPPHSALYTNYDFAQEFDLRPGATEFVDIAIFSETNPNAQIELCYATEAKKNAHIPRWVDSQCEHILHIEVYAEKGKKVPTQFKLWVDKSSHRFYCERTR